jgi:kynurenine formamidase
MTLIDLSQPVDDAGPNCPAHPPVSIQRIADHATDGWRMEKLSMASHTGSHVDAPLHKIAGGASLDEVPLSSFVGPAVIADLRGIAADTAIDSALLKSRLPDSLDDRIVLLATGWGDRRAKIDEWLSHSPFLSPDGASWLVHKGIRAVGIDHYSIGGSREPGNSRTHEILLGAGRWVVEELKFPTAVFSLPQPFTFWALPVNFANHSGSFCRPVAVAP